MMKPMPQLRAMPLLALLVALSACDDSSGGLRPIEGDGTFDPEQLDFGTVAVRSIVRRPVVIRNRVAGDAIIKSVRFEPASDAFSAKLSPSDAPLRGAPIPVNGHVDASVLFAPTAEQDYSTTLIAGIGDHEVALPITALGRNAGPARPAVEPSALSFIDVAVGRDAFNGVSVTNTGELPGVLHEIRSESSDPASPFSIVAAGGGRAVPSQPIAGMGAEMLDLEVHFRPAMQGTFSERFQLSFESGDPATLFVSGSAVPSGTLTCDAQSIDFGAVTRGSVLSRPVHCTVSGGEYTLARVGLSAGSSMLFQIPNAPSAIAPDQTLDFTVELHAEGLPAMHAGAVELVAEHGAITRIALAGEVTPPPVGMTDLSITLRWNTDLTDFDLHLVRNGVMPFEGSDDCYFSMKNPDWGTPGDASDDPFLDRDDTDGFGPEVVNIAHTRDATYDAYVHYYAYETSTAPPTQVTVEYAIRGAPVSSATLTMMGCGTMWHVGRFRFDMEPPMFVPDSLLTDQWKDQASAACR